MELAVVALRRSDDDNVMKIINGLLLGCSVIVLGGCAYVPPSNDKAKWYATIQDNAAKTELSINANEWIPLFGADGFGGNRRVMLYFAELDGVGPIYRDPVFGTFSAPELKTRCQGIITIDLSTKNVKIDLQQNVSKTNDVSKAEPNPANGTYEGNIEMI
jgi:hypothetical protein